MKRIDAILRDGTRHGAALVAAAAAVAFVLWQVRSIKRRCDAHETVRRNQAQFVIAVWPDKGRQGLREEAMRKLQALRDVDLSAAQRNLRDLTVAELLYGRVQDGLSGDPAGDLRQAEKLLDLMLRDCADDALRIRARNCQVLAGFEQRRWFVTTRRIDALWADYPESREKAELALLKAKCLSEMHQYRRALSLCEDVIGRAVDPVQARAHLEAGDAITKGIESGSVTALAVGRGWPAEQAEATAVAIREARGHYEAAMAGGHLGESSRVYAMNRLVEACIRQNDWASAARYAVESDSPLSFPGDRVRSMLLMARIDRGAGRVPEAVGRLRSCILKYPTQAESVDAHFELFELYRQTRNWLDAAALLQKLVSRFPDRATTVRILGLFLDADAALVRDVCRGGNPADGKAFRDVLLRLRKQSPTLWRQVHEATGYLLGLFEAERGNDEAAEAEFLRYLQQPLYADLRDRVLLADLACAERLRRPTAVIACRAKRYLVRYGSASRGLDVRMRLIAAYAQMGLHDAVVREAENGGGAELLEATAADGNASERAKRLCLIQTAQAYSRLGMPGKANLLLRGCLRRATGAEFPATVFVEWAAIAQGVGQLNEAARRLELGLLRQSDPRETRRLEAARRALDLRMNRPGAGAAAQAMLDSMGARTEQAAEVAGDWRELCQTLFENHAARGDLDAAAAVLTQAWRVCPEELWVQARLCRLLRLRSERGDVSGAAAWLAAAPDVYLGIGGAGTQVNELVRRQRDTVHQVARLADQVRKRQKGSGVGGEHVAEHRN